MKRSRVQLWLTWALALTSIFAAWSWLRPYSWKSDPNARSKIRGVQIRKDHGHYWLDIHLKMNSDQSHDLMKPVRLLLHDGAKELEPADTTLAGTDENSTTELWLKFWVEENDMNSPMQLKINDGMLTVKTKSGTPKLGPSKTEFFTTENW